MTTMKAKRQGCERFQIIDGPSESAITILARELNIPHENARAALLAIVKGGYWIAPREPTNAMLVAYITSYGDLPTNPQTMITAAGKARARWKAMGESGTARAMSGKNKSESKHQHLGGVARAQALTPERRTEIARKAAEARWGK